MVTKHEIKELSKSLGISLVGITTAERLQDLPCGDVSGVKRLCGVLDELPTASSVIVAACRVWDPIFNVVVSDPKWLGYGMHTDEEDFEFYQLYSEVVNKKAWQLANYLTRQGHEAVVAGNISLKPAAVKAGLGSRGKNTLVITPEYGPRVRFAAVLTSARLEPDEPFKDDLCGECAMCIVACPSGALHPYEINIKRCLTYAAESPYSPDVEEDVRALERKLIKKPTSNSFIECTICHDVCPIGMRKASTNSSTKVEESSDAPHDTV